MLFLGSIEECVNCSGCSCGGVECFEFDPSGDNGPPNGEACERGGCIDCSGSYAFILRRSILKIYYLIFMNYRYS